MVDGIGDAAINHQLSTIIFFFNDTATTEIYTLSLHDALPIFAPAICSPISSSPLEAIVATWAISFLARWRRSEEHTSELQSRSDLVCRLLLEKINGHPNGRHGGRAVPYLRNCHRGARAEAWTE